MKKILLASLLALFLAFSVFAQDEPENVKLPDAVMEQVVRRILTRSFKPRSKATKIRLYGQYIKSGWLPTIKNIQFVLVPEVTESLGDSVHFFRHVEKDGPQFVIGFGYGDPNCNGTGALWHFQVVNGRVRLTNTLGGFGMGCGSGG